MEAGCMVNPNSNISVMWKTVSEDCNLACDYCYYSTCGGKPGKQIKKIDVNVLEKFIKEYMAITRGVVSFAWQGGEPLLAGLNFFENVVALQAKNAPANTIISNGLQTNGTLINDRFAAFFKKYNFLIGVSLDGPREIHNLRRVYSHGKGSFDQVMKGIQHLRNNRVEFNILTVIHKDNVHRVKDLFEFYEQENFDFVQFIPCMDFHSQRIDQPGVYEITPKQYGDFLCEAFDNWYNDGNPKMSIRFFDNMLSIYVNREAELCTHKKSCAKTLVLEQNGDAFPCDFYIHPDWKIGNVGEDALTDILKHPLYDTFMQMKPNLPEKCQTCKWIKLCHGGCPRNRRWSDDLQQSDPDYFCDSFQQVYEYAHERMLPLAEKIRKNLFTQGLSYMYKGQHPARNDQCACGSGKKYKNCCMKIGL